MSKLIQLATISTISTLFCIGCASVHKPNHGVTEQHHRLAHITHHHGNAKAADKMAKQHGSHTKAHISMHNGDHHAAHQHAKQQVQAKH